MKPGHTDRFNGGRLGLAPSVMPRGVSVRVEDGIVLLDDGVSLVRLAPAEARGLAGALEAAWSRTPEGSDV